MNLWDIIKTAGSAVISATVPGGAAVISLVNAVLPDDKKLPETATGDQVRGALSSLPPEQQSELMNKQFDVDITQIKESGSALRTMLESESKSTHSSRAFIAKGSFLAVAFISCALVIGWFFAVLTKDASLVKSVMDGWPFVAAITGFFTALLRAYFGILKGESKNRLDTASGKQPVAGLLSALIK